jgi:hypothetical protein
MAVDLVDSFWLSKETIEKAFMLPIHFKTFDLDNQNLASWRVNSL